MIIRNKQERQVLMEGGRRLANILEELKKHALPGRSGEFFEKMAIDLTAKYEARPAFLGYEGFPAALCFSVNSCIVHGVADSTVLKEGDIVSFDFGIEYPAKDGFFTDAAITVPVGKAGKDLKRLIQVTNDALGAGIAVAQPGETTGSIGQAVESVVLKHGFGLVRQLVGHGVDKSVHEGPQVPNFGVVGKGEALVEGMVIAIEPMVTLGNGRVALGPDGFSYVSADGAWGAHAEHTVIITQGGPQVITRYQP